MAVLDLINDPRNTFLTKIIIYSFITIAFYFGFVTSIILIYENITNKPFVLEVALCIGIPQFIGVYLSVRLKKDEVNLLHAKLQKIVNKGTPKWVQVKYFERFHFFQNLGGEGAIPNIHWNNELKCRKFTRLMSNFIIANEAVLTLSVIYSTVCVLFGEYDTSNWVLQFPMKTPFDGDTVIGWYFIWCIQFILSLIYSVCMVTVTTFFVCCCFYTASLCDHFEELCRLISSDAEQMKIRKTERKVENVNLKLDKRLCEAVDLHVTIFE